jgi:hypothetical protein
MAQNRRAPRHIVRKAGTVRFRGRGIDCLVRNLSTSGAAIEVAYPTEIPERFVLVLPDDGLHLACRAVWRSEGRIGVSFG